MALCTLLLCTILHIYIHLEDTDASLPSRTQGLASDNCPSILISNSYPNTDLEISVTQLFPSLCYGSWLALPCFPWWHIPSMNIYKHISKHNLLFTSVLYTNWPHRSISPGLPLLQQWHWAPKPISASPLPHILRLALRSRSPGVVHSWSLSFHILAIWNLVWGDFPIRASWLLSSDDLRCPPFHVGGDFCRSWLWHTSHPSFSLNQTDLSCIGWLACWQSTMLSRNLLQFFMVQLLPTLTCRRYLAHWNILIAIVCFQSFWHMITITHLQDVAG